jgi:hypothetical protein
MPNAVSLQWTPFPQWTSVISATVIDPEASRTEQLTAQDAMLRWDHQLAQDPVPTIDAVTVEPTQVPVPLRSLLLLAVSVDTSSITQIYLVHRHVLDMAERGGARGRV